MAFIALKRGPGQCATYKEERRYELVGQTRRKKRKSCKDNEVKVCMDSFLQSDMVEKRKGQILN